MLHMAGFSRHCYTVDATRANPVKSDRKRHHEHAIQHASHRRILADTAGMTLSRDVTDASSSREQARSIAKQYIKAAIKQVCGAFYRSRVHFYRFLRLLSIAASKQMHNAAISAISTPGAIDTAY